MCTQYSEVPAVPAARPDDHTAAGALSEWGRRHGHPPGADALSPTHRTAVEDRHLKGTFD